MTLEEILKEMRTLKTGGDPEVEHGRADDLLEHTVLLLARLHNEPTALEIITEYEEVEKWYA